MQKFLVVGCGGSGAKTLEYMMDQLKATLKRQGWEKNRLPQAWQFVALDVPIEPESSSTGLPNVRSAGGRYVGIGTTASYNEFDASVSADLAKSAALGEIATWAARHPSTITTPISDGAGQYRGLGRMLTIPALGRLRSELEDAVSVMNSGAGELDEFAYRVTGTHQDTSNTAPIVLVVSSMAGGAGASMFLDVCRVLSTLPTVSAGNTAVFMYTPEIFEQINKSQMTGAWPNSLAVFGEAFATQTGAAHASDRELFNAMGISGTGGGSTFARILPIGARMGAMGTLFGDGQPSTIYRGMGRSLAALVSSEKASGSFKSYFFGNTGSPAANRALLGWADEEKLSWDALPWGTWGYAQLSMGRDRYAEYSAQRLARIAFDRLLTAHLDPTSPATGEEQLRKKLDEKTAPLANENLYLSTSFLSAQPNNAEIDHWLKQVFNAPEAAATMQAQSDLRASLPEGDGQRGRDWVPVIRGRLADPGVARSLQAPLADAAYDAAYAYANVIANNTVAMAEKQLAENGLPFTIALVERLRDAISNRVVQSLKSFLAERAGASLLAPPAGFEQQMGELSGSGTVKQSGQILDNITGLYGPQLGLHFRVAVASILQPALEDFSHNVLKRLHTALNDSLEVLQRDDNVQVATLNLADVATDEPVAWPRESDQRVNDRFRGSHNEILITEVDRFLEDFNSHLLDTVQANDKEVRDHEQAARRAARAVILGEWITEGYDLAPQNTLAPALTEISPDSNRVSWVSPQLTRRPKSSNSLADPREPRPAIFDIKLRPDQLLDRARSWINRPNYHFSRFISMDLRTYLLDDQANEIEKDARVSRLRSAFREALDQARPLAAVDPHTLRAVHGTEVEFHFSFSEIPFKDTNAADELAQILESRPDLTSQTTQAFDKALAQKANVQQIDVFGSYPNYSPIVYSSLIDPIGEDWNNKRNNPEGFWKLRRTRPLAGSLPMSNDERQAMVAGWIIGAITGRIYVANQGQHNATAHVYDDRAQAWVDFPNPMLTPPAAMQSMLDWMPAVIESSLVAYATVQTVSTEGAVGGSLRPYHLLRSLYDDNPVKKTPVGRGINHPAANRLADYLATGERPGQQPSGTSIEERYQAVKEALENSRRNASQFIPDSTHTLPGQRREDKPFAEVTSRSLAAQMPLYRDLAPDVAVMIPELLQHLEMAKNMALNPTVPGPHNDTEIAAPETPRPQVFGDGGLF